MQKSKTELTCFDVIQISGKLWGKTKAWRIGKGKLTTRKGKKGEKIFCS
jgi:hypothetical protein